MNSFPVGTERIKWKTYTLKCCVILDTEEFNSVFNYLFKTLTRQGPYFKINMR